MHSDKAKKSGNLHRLFAKSGGKTNEDTARLIKTFAGDDHKRIAKLIQAWLVEDEKDKPN
ncbi:hypothetical protein [Lacimicrobium alkaliphilum]|uniref:Death domain-containing protein n=1 Tax=Lacimicrobium alkaliphilum TaxID=1526571 RepID=A0ABQ1R1I0_9ALTE|nr:hypothetical protein [Lacimicrobium alkaliphilum]GGD53030.1 hypothetical protein GCM10011357_06110 [Lacimicrobium alkaliphilum]